MKELNEKDYRKKHDDKVKEDEEKRKNKRRNALGTVANDKRDPASTKEDESQYIRSQNMAIKYQESITQTSEEVDALLSEDTFGMTQSAIENRQIVMESKINTMKQMTSEYKKHHADISNLGKANTLEHHMESLKQVLELSTLLEAKLRLEGERDKKKLALKKQKNLKE